jgi:hypothetical protein
MRCRVFSPMKQGLSDFISLGLFTVYRVLFFMQVCDLRNRDICFLRTQAQKQCGIEKS